MADDNKVVPIWEGIDKDITAECERALTRYRAGDDDVRLELGGLAIRLYDRKDNADRETVRMTMEEFVNAIRMSAMRSHRLRRRPRLHHPLETRGG